MGGGVKEKPLLENDIISLRTIWGCNDDPQPNSQERNSRPAETKANSPRVPQTCKRGARKAGSRSWAQGSYTPSMPDSARSRSAPNQRPLDGRCPPPDSADIVRAAHGEASRLAKSGRAHTAAARKGLFPGPLPAPAWSAPPLRLGFVPALPGPGPGRSAGPVAAAAEY